MFHIKQVEIQALLEFIYKIKYMKFMNNGTYKRIQDKPKKNNYIRHAQHSLSMELEKLGESICFLNI